MEEFAADGFQRVKHRGLVRYLTFNTQIHNECQQQLLKTMVT